MSLYKANWEELQWESPFEGIRHKALREGGRQLRLVEYTPDVEPHWCEKGHFGYVLSGRFEIKFDDVTEIYEPGDGVFIPSGAEHRHMGTALTDVVRAIFVEDI